MSGTSLNVILFLISWIFDFYVMILFVRLMLAWVNADYNHPLTQFIVRMTSSVVKPIKKYIPDFRGVELATIVVILLVVMIKFLILTIMTYGLPNLFALLILMLADGLRLFLATLSLIFIFEFLLGLMQPNSPIYPILSQITAPLARPMRKLIPPIKGFDITPLIWIVILQLLIIIVCKPITSYALYIAS